jgi:hypothetical protein
MRGIFLGSAASGPHRSWLASSKIATESRKKESRVETNRVIRVDDTCSLTSLSRSPVQIYLKNTG